MPKVTLPAPIWYLKSGFRVDRLGPDNNLALPPDTIVVEFGSCTDLFTGADLYYMPTGGGYLYANPLVVGPGGRDVDTIWPAGTEVNLWLIADDVNNNLEPLFSASGGMWENVACPVGWHIVTQLLFSAIWKVWLPGQPAGFPDFHYQGGQAASYNLTQGAQLSNKFAFTENFDAGVTRSLYIPQIVPISVARLIDVTAILYPQGGSAGSAIIGINENESWPLGTVAPGQQIQARARFRVESDGSYFIKTTGGLKVDAWVTDIGWTLTT